MMWGRPSGPGRARLRVEASKPSPDQGMTTGWRAKSAHLEIAAVETHTCRPRPRSAARISALSKCR